MRALLLFLIPALGFSALGFSALGFSAEPCKPKQLFGSCNAFARAPINLSGSHALGLPIVGTDEVIFNAVAGVQVESAARAVASPSQEARAREVAARTLEAARSLVRGNTPAELLSKEQKAFLARLDSVAVKVPASGTEDCKGRDPTEKITPQASYDSASNTLLICPNAAKLTPAALQMMLSHEVGHIVSPCSMAQDLYKVHSLDFRQCLTGSSERQEAKELIVSQPMALVPVSLSASEKKIVSKLLACGKIEAMPAKAFNGKPVLYEKLSACLDGAYAKSWRSALKNAGSHPKYLEERGNDLSLRCHGIYDEHFADAMGSRIFGKVLRGASNAREAVQVAMMMNASNACADEAEPAGEAQKNGYPPSAERLVVGISSPEVQATLGCQMQATSCGVKDFLVYPAVAAAQEPAAAGGASAQ